jgi:hypothetical protein
MVYPKAIYYGLFYYNGSNLALLYPLRRISWSDYAGCRSDAQFDRDIGKYDRYSYFLVLRLLLSTKFKGSEQLWFITNEFS